MSAIPKKKLCWNCEGRVALADENCPYCGVYLSSSALLNNQDENATHVAPYRTSSEKTIPASPYNLNREEQDQQDEESNEIQQEEALNSTQKSSLMPFVLLLAGSVFLTFGLILLIFSNQGTLTLQWNASYWFVYLAIAGLFLITGWRSLRNLK